MFLVSTVHPTKSNPSEQCFGKETEHNKGTLSRHVICKEEETKDMSQ